MSGTVSLGMYVSHCAQKWPWALYLLPDFDTNPHLRWPKVVEHQNFFKNACIWDQLVLHHSDAVADWRMWMSPLVQKRDNNFTLTCKV